MTRYPRDTRGQSLSVFVLTVMFALLLVAGLVVDGGAQSMAARRASQAAAAAARAAVDAGAVSRAAGTGPDTAVVAAAAQGVLDEREVTGTVAITAGRVQVTASSTTKTIFLSVIGISSLTGWGTAESDLKTP